MREILVRGERCLAVSLGGRGKALSRILSLKASPGWLVSGAFVEEWRFQGVSEQGGVSFLYGPWSGAGVGTLLSDALALPLPEAIRHLSRLADALSLLAERRVPWFPLQTDSVLFTHSGGVLFLPPGVVQELRNIRTLSQNLDAFERINHPDLSGERLISFSLAAMLFRMVSGAFPFTADSAEVVHEEARKLELVSPRRSVPGLDPEASEMAMAGLGRTSRAIPSLKEWAEALGRWKGKDLFVPVSEGQRERTRREGDARRAETQKSFRRRVFWERNWKTIAITSAIVIVGGIVLGSILKGVFAPRPTRGFTPRAVAEAFYTAMNGLDHQLMQACVAGRAGRQEIDEVTTLYVTSRVTLGYEGRSTIISAAEWDRRGRPVLDPPLFVYGVTDLTLEQEMGEPQPVFLAKYVKWIPVGAGDESPGKAETGAQGRMRNTDRLRLRKDRGYWVIFKIDRLQSERPSPP